MQKAWKVILILSITINLVLGFILLSKPKSKEPNYNIYIERIDSLELELSTLRQIRDSVRSSIDTIATEISNNKDNYEKIRNIILSNSVSDDYLFFTEYLSKREQRYDSINNP